MGRRKRRGFTATEKTELWDRWQRGESLKGIGRAFGKPSSSIYAHVSPRGGIRPALRCRSRLALTLSERETISRGIAAQQSTRSMARHLGRSPSTVSREISRNSGYNRYRAAQAEKQAWLRARRSKPCKLASRPWLRETVARKLGLHWSPEQRRNGKAIPAGRSRIWSRSASGRPRSRIGRFLVTGRAIYCRDRRTVTL